MQLNPLTPHKSKRANHVYAEALVANDTLTLYKSTQWLVL